MRDFFPVCFRAVKKKNISKEFANDSLVF